MKKILAGILVLVIILSTIGCSLDTTASSSNPSTTKALDKVYAIVKEKGDATDNNDINNPLVERYTYSTHNEKYDYEAVTVHIDEETGTPSYCSYECYGNMDDKQNQTNYQNIHYVYDICLYPNGEVHYKVNYSSPSSYKPFLCGDIYIEPTTYSGPSTELDTSDCYFGSASASAGMDTEDAKPFILNNLYEHLVSANDRLKTLTGVSLSDWGFKEFE